MIIIDQLLLNKQRRLTKQKDRPKQICLFAYLYYLAFEIGHLLWALACKLTYRIVY